MSAAIYKLCPQAMWDAACANGRFEGMPVDIADGFIHFSTAEQVAETAARHFSDVEDLLLIAYDPGGFGARLKWEVSRGGALFPHLYDQVDPAGALWAVRLQRDGSGRHILPDLGR